MHVSKSAYINQALKEFGLEKCRYYTTPMISTFFEELFHHAGQAVLNGEKYRNIIDCLQFLADDLGPRLCQP